MATQGKGKSKAKAKAKALDPTKGKGKAKALDTTKLKRRVQPGAGGAAEPERPKSVSAGAVGMVIDLAFNPTRDKMREMTIIDRVQGRLFPQMDMINMLRQHCLAIAAYREAIAGGNGGNVEPPVEPDVMDEFLYRTAQWQKSVGGKNMEKAVDIALAEIETRSDDDDPVGADPWKD